MYIKLLRCILRFGKKKNMKTLIPILFSLVVFCSNAFADGMQFFHGTFEEALEIAKEEDKLIFVDAFTTWCGPCKKMSKNVFPQKEVGDFYNENFINMKMDMESQAGRKFESTYTVGSYPTFLFINGAGDIVLKDKGAKPVESFIKVGKAALSKHDSSEKFAKMYEEGDRSPKTVLKYIKSLNRNGENSLKVANDYLKKSTPMNEENLKILYEATTQADSRIFDKFLQNETKLSSLLGEEKIMNKAKFALENTIQKAIEYQTVALMDEVYEKANKSLGKDATAFNQKAEIIYQASTKNVEETIKSSKKYLKKSIAQNFDAQFELSQILFENFENEKQVLSFNESLICKCAKQTAKPEHLGFSAKILHLNGKKQEALDALSIAISTLEEQKQVSAPYHDLKRYIENN